MRPGPGLVVMALAFISGARRGTSQQQIIGGGGGGGGSGSGGGGSGSGGGGGGNSDSDSAGGGGGGGGFSVSSVVSFGGDNNSAGRIGGSFNIGTDNSGGPSDQVDKYYKDGENFTINNPLSRINPWLSACDLAQPNSTPDLQGQCSSGTLPVAWINEGPGPPECPVSCETLRIYENNYNIKMNNNNNKNNNKYNNYNNINDNNINNNNNNNNNTKNNTNYYKIMNMENRFEEEKQRQQCLDYLGDSEESSPAKLCRKSPSEIASKLLNFRLRHCCERTVISSIYNELLSDVLNGGSKCIRTLNDLLDTDSLATRITCEFNEVLIRYDCRQLYSIKHGCRDCKESYRRWVCSTLIPYYAEPDDIRQIMNVNKNGDISKMINKTNYDNNNNNNNIKNNNNNIYNNNNNNNNNINNNDNINSNSIMGLQEIELNFASRFLKRSRRKSEPTTRKKIRPCLSVCQTVEETCPYLLPGDRAPAHPTQYAGEPTFLCLDSNIPETGEQYYKSNHGPDGCCYVYCSASVYDGICGQYCLTHNNTMAEQSDIKDENVTSTFSYHEEMPPSQICTISPSQSSTSTCITTMPSMPSSTPSSASSSSASASLSSTSILRLSCYSTSVKNSNYFILSLLLIHLLNITKRINLSFSNIWWL